MAAMRLYENGHTRANDLEMVDGLWGNRRRKGARSERRLCDGQILVWGGMESAQATSLSRFDRALRAGCPIQARRWLE